MLGGKVQMILVVLSLFAVSALCACGADESADPGVYAARQTQISSLEEQTQGGAEAGVASLKPSPCAEECWAYYVSCLGTDPTPIRQHICRQDYEFCLKTWPHCVPPVR